MNDITESTRDLGCVIEDVANGIASENDTGLVMKSLQMSMTLRLGNGLASMLNTLNSQQDLLNKAVEKYNEKLQEMIDSDTATAEDLLNFINSTQKKQLDILEVYRRCLQNGDIFTSDSLGSEERLVLGMLKSLKTPEDKAKFFKMCKQSHLFD